MAKRVVKETDSYGKGYYVVETNRILGFIPCKWRVCYYSDSWGYNNYKFSSKEEAINFIETKRVDIFKREVIVEYK